MPGQQFSAIFNPGLAFQNAFKQIDKKGKTGLLFFVDEVDRLPTDCGAATFFKVVTENIHKDVAGANKDQIDLWTNQIPDHEDRIVDLEEHAGIQTGPRFQHIK